MEAGARSVSTQHQDVLVVDALIAPPQPLWVITRKRLMERLACDTPVTTIVAPPGSGKTMLARQFVDAGMVDSDRPRAWLTLDFVDDDPHAFWQLLISALRRIQPCIDDQPEQLLVQLGGADRSFLVVLIAQLETAGVPAVMVLDRVPRVSDRAVLDALALLIDRVGHIIHFILVGRCIPELPIGRWRAAGWLTEITDNDLRFTDAEAVATGALIADLAYGPDEIVAVNRRVEGWVTGVVLTLLSGSDRHISSCEAVQIDGSDPLFADYFATEVLNRLLPAEREVALALSVLDSFDIDLCRDLLGNHAVPVARELQRGHVFLSVSDRRGGTLRFMPLLRTMLENELRWSDPDRWSLLHRSAAMLSRNRSDLVGAHHHLTRAGDLQEAAELVIQPVLELVDRGDWRGLAAMMRSLQRVITVDDPALALDVAAAWVFAGNLHQSTQWCDRGEALVSPDDATSQLRVCTLRGMISLLLGDLEMAAQHVAEYERLADHRATGPLESRFATTAARVMLSLRRLDEADIWVRRACEISGPDAIVKVTVPSLVAWLALERGRVGAARRRAEQACAAADELGMRPHHGAFDALVVAGWCRLAAGDLAGAAQFSDAAAADADVLGQPWNNARSGLLAAEVQRVTAGPAAALHVLSDLRSQFRAGPVVGNHFDHALVAAEAMALVISGQSEAAQARIERLPDNPARRLLAAHVASSLKSPRAVEETVGDTSDWSRHDQLVADVLHACAFASPRAEELLSDVVSVGATTGWVSPFLGRGDAVDELLSRLPLDRLHPELAGIARGPVARDTNPVGAHATLSSRELTILELLPTHLAYAQIGERLFVSVNTIKTNVKSIYRKLGVTSRSEAVDVARRSRLL